MFHSLYIKPLPFTHSNRDSRRQKKPSLSFSKYEHVFTKLGPMPTWALFRENQKITSKFSINILMILFLENFRSYGQVFVK